MAFLYIPGKREEDYGDDEGRQGKDEDKVGDDQDDHAGKAHDDGHDGGANHRQEQPVHKKPKIFAGKLVRHVIKPPNLPNAHLGVASHVYEADDDGKQGKKGEGDNHVFSLQSPALN